jgi:hypothetical protein
MEEEAIEIVHGVVEVTARLWEEAGFWGLIAILVLFAVGIGIYLGLSKLSTIIRDATNNSQKHRWLLKLLGLATDGVRGIILAFVTYCVAAAVLGVVPVITILVAIGAAGFGFALTRNVFGTELTWVKRSGGLLLVGCGLAILCCWTWWLLQKSETFSTAHVQFTIPIPLDLPSQADPSPLRRPLRTSPLIEMDEISTRQHWLIGSAVVALLVGLWNGYQEARQR